MLSDKIRLARLSEHHSSNLPLVTRAGAKCLDASELKLPRRKISYTNDVFYLAEGPRTVPIQDVAVCLRPDRIGKWCAEGTVIEGAIHCIFNIKKFG